MGCFDVLPRSLLFRSSHAMMIFERVWRWGDVIGGDDDKATEKNEHCLRFVRSSFTTASRFCLSSPSQSGTAGSIFIVLPSQWCFTTPAVYPSSALPEYLPSLLPVFSTILSCVSIAPCEIVNRRKQSWQGSERGRSLEGTAETQPGVSFEWQSQHLIWAKISFQVF